MSEVKIRLIKKYSNAVTLGYDQKEITVVVLDNKDYRVIIQGDSDEYKKSPVQYSTHKKQSRTSAYFTAADMQAITLAYGMIMQQQKNPKPS